MAVIGLDLGGTKLAGAIFSDAGKILHKTVVPLGGRQGAQVCKLITDEINNFFQVARAEKIELSAIGISVPGISCARTGKVWVPNIPGWENFPLRKKILDALPDKKNRVTIESDRACYILGEAWRGVARGCNNAIFLAVGTGIGAGIMIDGKILRGANDISGAIGWLALNRPFQSKYTSCGCFEHHASGEGLAKVAKEFLAADKNYSGTLRTKKQIVARDVFDAHKTGDLIAKKVLDEAAEFWGMAVANLVSLFNPEKIIFGGGVFGPAKKFLPWIFSEAKKWAQPIAIRKTKLEPSKLGGDAGLYGAGYLALRSLEKNN